MIGQTPFYSSNPSKVAADDNQIELHFDYINGDDRNSGSTAANPLKTVKQYVYREDLSYYTSRLDVYIHGDMGPDDLLYIPGALFGNGYKYIHFVPNANQILHNGILTGVIHFNQITGQWDEIQETGFDFNP
jgi:hypothetical protein